MKDIQTNGTPLRANKFMILNLVENNVVLINKNKEETINSLIQILSDHVKIALQKNGRATTFFKSREPLYPNILLDNLGCKAELNKFSTPR